MLLTVRASRRSRAAAAGAMTRHLAPSSEDADTDAADEPAGSADRRRMPRRALVRNYVARFLAGMTGLPTARRIAPALALSLVSWVGQAATYHLAALAVGLPVSLAASVTAMLTVNLAFIVQVTPGNVGVVQVLYALVMRAHGIPGGAAVGAAVVLQALQIAPVTAIALALAPELALRRRRPERPSALAAPGA